MEISTGVARLLLSGLLLLIAVIFIAGDVGLWNLWRAQTTLKSLQDEIQQLEQETQYLEKKVIDLQEDPFEIERVARERYGYLRPGDKVFRIITISPDAENDKKIPTFLDTKAATP